MEVMLFPWNFSGIIWLPGGMPWNSMECHGHYVISMELQCNSMASRWNAMEFHGIQKIGTLTKLVSGSIKEVEIHGIWPTKWLPTINSRNLLNIWGA